MKKLVILLLLIPFISNAQWTEDEFFVGPNGISGTGSIEDSLSIYYDAKNNGGLPSYIKDGLWYMEPQDPNLFEDSILSQVDKQIQIFVDLVNQSRIEKGLNPLTYNREMEQRVSKVHNTYQVIKGKVYHPNKVHDYSFSAEIATGGFWNIRSKDNGEGAFNSFKRSPSHWFEIIHPHHTEISVSLIYVDETEFHGRARAKLSGSYYVICNFK